MPGTQLEGFKLVSSQYDWTVLKMYNVYFSKFGGIVRNLSLNVILSHKNFYTKVRKFSVMVMVHLCLIVHYASPSPSPLQRLSSRLWCGQALS